MGSDVWRMLGPWVSWATNLSEIRLIAGNSVAWLGRLAAWLVSFEVNPKRRFI